MILKLIPKKSLLLYLGDFMLILFSFLLAKYLRFGIVDHIYFENAMGAFFISCAYVFVYYLADLYDINESFKNSRYIARFFAANIITAGIVSSMFFFAPSLEHRRGVLLLCTLLVPLLTYLWRLWFKFFFRQLLANKKKVAIIGSGWGDDTLNTIVTEESDYIVESQINIEPATCNCCGEFISKLNCMKVNRLVAEKKIDILITAMEGIRCVHLLKSILRCKMMGIDVSNMPAFYEEVTGKLPVIHLDDYWFVSAQLLGVKRWLYNKKIKKITDIIFSLTGLLLTLPICLLTAAAIKLESAGPVFYKQKRVGLNNKIFEVIKFRSMGVDAENKGAIWAKVGDSRVTKVGKFIRKTRIDEIPQMWNVLQGEMSFIGPRPERPEFVEILNEKIPYYSFRHFIKPGITGWAQVNCPYGASIEDSLEKLQYDLFYIKNLIPSLDFHILVKTVKVVLFGKGAR